MNYNRRVYAYDFLKIVATFCIMCHHYQQAFAVRFPNFIDFYGGRFYWGYLVEFFFLLSGWGIANKLENCKIDCTLKSYFTFLLDRYIRFWPIVFTASLAEYFIANSYYYRYNDFISWETVYSYYDIVLNMMGLAVGSFYHYSYWCINSPLWYINVLLMCYAIMCVELYVCNKFKWNKLFFFWGTFSIGVFFLALYAIMGDISYVPFFNIWMARGYMGFFGGLILYRYMKTHYVAQTQFFILSVLIVAVIILILLNNDLIIKYTQPLTCCILWPAIILVFSKQRINDIFFHKTVAKLSKLSLIMYAFHSPFISACKYLERALDVSVDKSQLSIMFLYLLCMVVISYFIQMVLDRSVRYVNRLIKL